MPHTGSTASATAGCAGAGARARRGRSATISAYTDSAISAGVRAPMSRPAGVCTPACSSSVRSSGASTAAPRLRLATSPT